MRALAQLLPDMKVMAGCPYNCDPAADPGSCAEACAALRSRHGPRPGRTDSVVDLPLGATEDRVIGALDLERALTRGEKAFEPGLLAAAHRGFLYVDEVNLLEDHLVDVLLDVAASGVNVVEREGLSVRHPAACPGGQRQPRGRGIAAPASRPLRLGGGHDADGYRHTGRGRAPAGSVRVGLTGLVAARAKEDKIRRRIGRAKKKLEDIEVPDAVARAVGSAWPWVRTGYGGN